MRTTVDLPDDLLRSVKIAAAERGVSLKALFISALRHELGTAHPDISHRRVQFPLVRTRHSDDPLLVTNDDVEEVLSDDDAEKYRQ